MKTKVFISWSGERSRQIGELLNSWLPKAIQSVETFFSHRNIDSGAMWVPELMEKLASSSVGICCLTPENLAEPWLLFEAGAIAKRFDGKKTCLVPYLFGLNKRDVTEPYSLFQMCQAASPDESPNREDALKLIEAVNSQAEDEHRIKDNDLPHIFDTWWPELSNGLASIEKPSDVEEPEQRTSLDISSETLDRVRSIERIISTRDTSLTREERNRQRNVKGDEIRLLTHRLVKAHHTFEERESDDEMGIIDDHHRMFSIRRDLKNAVLEYNDFAFRGGYLQLDEESDDPFGLYGRDYPGTGTASGI